MKKKHKVAAVVLSVVVLGAICGCLLLHYQSKKQKEEIQRNAEEMAATLEYLDKYWFYAEISSNPGANIYHIINLVKENPAAYKEIIFYNEKPDVIPDETIAVYPSDKTYAIVERTNERIEKDNIDVASFNLSNPITIEDIKNKQAQMIEFINSLDTTTYRYIFTYTF